MGLTQDLLLGHPLGRFDARRSDIIAFVLPQHAVRQRFESVDERRGEVVRKR